MTLLQVSVPHNILLQCYQWLLASCSMSDLVVWPELFQDFQRMVQPLPGHASEERGQHANDHILSVEPLLRLWMRLCCTRNSACVVRGKHISSHM